MIVGHVNQNLEAIFPLRLRDTTGREHAIDAVIDTGFNGSLTLPIKVISDLDLAWHGREQGRLADGSIGLFDIYAAPIIWDNGDRIVETVATEGTPLVGMNLLRGHELHIQIVEKGNVIIKLLVE
jgi:clan AA aspartic protease